MNDKEQWLGIARASLEELMARAAELRDDGHGRIVTYSRKVFIPLTRLCRDVCHYCSFARSPREGERAYLSPDEVLDIARAGKRAGCQEALFTLGDKPELRYRQATDELEQLGHATTMSYLVQMCERVLRETGLLPHANPGAMSREDIAALRRVSASQGLMLESHSGRLCERGGPHFGSPDKQPAARLETLRLAGELAVPFTTGILVGIGETREERIDSLLALRELHLRHGHLQEIIVQNFCAKPGTLMAQTADAQASELKWTIAMARLIFGPGMNIQAPPNLSARYWELINAGINDWGGVSPVTPDHVNPEAPWPQIEALRRETAAAGKTLVERLTIYPRYACQPARWVDPAVVPALLAASDASGYARADAWSPGVLGVPLTVQTGPHPNPPPQAGEGMSQHPNPPPQAGEGSPHLNPPPRAGEGREGGRVSARLEPILERLENGERANEEEVVTLFEAREADFRAVCEAADGLRARASGEIVRYVVNRNINYTNICAYKCGFCAFSKGRTSERLRGAPYDLPLEEVQRRVREAWARGATEVCMQGGIHPYYTGETYLGLCRAVKDACPGMHIHAFSPLEVTHGAQTLGLSVGAFLQELQAVGLGTLPGTAAEILDDEVRAVICPDKLSTAQWLQVMRDAHALGLRSTATVMYGHVECPAHWARHLLHLRDLQQETGGFTEFVPLPFVHMESPLYLKGRARRGPTSREAVLMHAVARLVLHPFLANIQTSWVKMGPDGARLCLQAGANDLGGTLMNESISRAAGTEHGQECAPEAMEGLIRGAGRVPQQRTTLYGRPSPERESASRCAAPITEVRLGPPRGRKARVSAAQVQSNA
ncbi:MAG: 7,8-didemethyl-8-hydroxy-5-deazariboflavin synthase [Betaproteobacteria bacterium RIFCSPLOWO2_02_FULL_65_24]|nr:MAG: 7,8-didemethyl-8-hydroxy-5-deazariboflavin synthase [Betaproteobacteria bacterium RIFCSPLOWO2_02_FULL_65_24]